MELKIKTTGRAVEVVNYLLGRAFHELSNNERFRKLHSMTTNELQICSFEQAVALKKAGFNWKLPYYYDRDGKCNLSNNVADYNSNQLDTRISAPTVALLSELLKLLKNEKD